MRLILRATRIVGAFIALGLFLILAALLVQNLRDFGFTPSFVWGQLLPVYLPSAALLMLLLVPFSRIHQTSLWTTLFVAAALLSLIWLVPSALRALSSSPVFDVTVPPGEGVRPKIFVTPSYTAFLQVGVTLAFLLTQLLAIWFSRQRSSALPNAA